MEIQEWQKGNDSKLNSMDRMIKHTEWLKQIHKEIMIEINKKKPVEPEQPRVGFPD